MWVSLLAVTAAAGPTDSPYGQTGWTSAGEPGARPPLLGAIDPRVAADPGDPEPVVGGEVVPAGKWDDAVGVVFFDSYVGCTGTLIGPRVVLTAGHCVNSYPVTSVLVGNKNWIMAEGELIDVLEQIEYPGSQMSYDVGLLLLARDAPYAPRAIGMDCVLADLRDGVEVQIVGYGLTNETGTGFNTVMHEAPTTVLDANCDQNIIDGIASGCHANIRPGGEIAAGGHGTDACFGDSGGPLYLETDAGTFVVGVTSRTFLGVNPSFPCRDGGIWVRPDAIVDWIESEIGQRKITYPSCNEAPEASVDDIVTAEGQPGSAVVSVDDPDGDDSLATVTVVEDPEHGSVSVDGHALTYTPDAGFVGADGFTVEVADVGTGKLRTGAPIPIELDVAVQVDAADDAGGGEGAGCGCASPIGPASGAPAGMWTLAGLAAVGAIRARGRAPRGR